MCYMTVFKLRVVIDTEDDIFRDIEVTEENTLTEFHNEIIKSYAFDGGQMASFFKTDEDWEKGEEFPLIDMSADPENSSAKTMNNTTIGELIKDKGDRLLYVYDFLRMWCFFVEVIETRKTQKDEQLPQTTLSIGTAPDEESKDLDFSHPASDLNLDFDDEFGDEDDFGGGFDDIDDYDEFR